MHLARLNIDEEMLDEPAVAAPASAVRWTIVLSDNLSPATVTGLDERSIGLHVVDRQLETFDRVHWG